MPFEKRTFKLNTEPFLLFFERGQKNETMKTQTGPKVTISFSCSDCQYCKSESYRCQGDSGHDVFCEHPNFEERKRVGDTNWNTPDYCPYKKEALEEKIKEKD